MSRGALLSTLALGGLTMAPAQSWGAVRLVPLLRRTVRADLRLALRRYDEAAAIVGLRGASGAPELAYISYVPHGLVMSWSDDGSEAAFGAQLGDRRHDGRRHDLGFASVRVAHRMARREDSHQLRFLPLHLAMEGFLALCFGGPQIAWSEYSRQALRSGLDPRAERTVRGAALPGFDDALRVFELHEQQVGVLVLVADALASAFVVSHPQDYAALHRSLLEDFYCELLVRYGLYGGETPMEAAMEAAISDQAAAKISSLAELASALEELRHTYQAFQLELAADLLGRPVVAERVYRAGPFQLQRFRTQLDLARDNHLGEAIVDENDELLYLKTYRLSAAQARRGHLLSKLAEHHWNLDATAASLGHSKDELLLRLDKAGFGYLIKEHVLTEARRRKR